MPVRAEVKAVIERDQILAGRLEIFENGFMFTDTRLGMFVVPFSAVECLKFHIDESRVQDWLHVTVNRKGENQIPA